MNVFGKIIGILLIALGALMAISVFQVAKALVVGGYGSPEDAFIKAGLLFLMAIIAMFMVKKGVDSCQGPKVKNAECKAA